MADYRSLTVEIADHVAEVTLRGPGRGNAMGPDFWREMPELFAALDADAAVRAVLVRGAGSHFSTGLDLSPDTGILGELMPVLSGEQQAAARTRLYDVILRMQRACSVVAESRKPVVAAIAGRCLGGGVNLASACDVRLCSADAVFSMREVRIAMVADIGSLQRLPRIIGDGPTRELALTGRDFDAARALRLGLVSDVFPDGEALLSAARETARLIARNPPLVVQGVKQVMNDTEHLSVPDGLRHVAVWNAAFLQSRDLVEALTAFVEKRAPVFRGD